MWTPLESQYDVRISGISLLIYICNFHVLSNLLLIYICELHWNAQIFLRALTVGNEEATPEKKKMIRQTKKKLNFEQFKSAIRLISQRLGLDLGQFVEYIHETVHFLLIYIWNFHVLNHLLLIYICKLHWNLNTMFVCQVIFFWFTYEISMS